MTAPDLTEKVLGFRSWRIDGDRLEPLTATGHPWLPGANTAVCDRSVLGGAAPFVSFINGVSYQDHDPAAAPAPGCHCGLYAWHTQDLVIGQLDYRPQEGVIGAVACWGRLEVHHDGIRAQHAQVIALAYAGHQPYDTVQKIKHLAAVYGVPCVPAAELETVAAEHASPCPQSLRPEWDPLRHNAGLALGGGYGASTVVATPVASGWYIAPSFPLHLAQQSINQLSAAAARTNASLARITPPAAKPRRFPIARLLIAANAAAIPFDLIYGLLADHDQLWLAPVNALAALIAWRSR